MNTEKEPIWNALNMNRSKGDTTLKTCGWCKYGGSGAYRYNCMIHGSCSLLKSYDGDVNWDTECKISKLGKSDLESIIGNKKYQINNCLSQIKSLEDEIKTINSISKTVKNMPVLPDNRGSKDDYKIGEKIWVFIEKNGEKIPKTKWYSGVVVSGYRSGDGCVSYVLDELPQSNQGWGCGVSTPVTLKDWEYKYFKKNREDFVNWLNLSDRDYNGIRLPLRKMLDTLYAC